MISVFYAIDSVLNDRIIGSLWRWLSDRSYYWQKPLIIVGVLLLSAALGYKGSPRQFQLVFALLPGVAVALVLLRWPQLGLIGIIVAGLLVPYSGPSGIRASAILVAVLLGLWVLDMLVRQRELTLPSSISTAPLLVMLLMATLSFGFGQLPWYTFAESAPLGGQLGGLVIYFLSAGAFLLIARLSDLRWLKWLVWVFLAIGSICMFGLLVPGGSRVVYSLFAQGAAGSLFWVWLVALSFSQAVFNKELNLSKRLFLGSLTLATLYVGVVLNSDWKSGWIPSLITAAAIVGVYYWRLVLLVAPFVVIPASTAAAYIIATDQYSWSTRVEAWLIVVEITKASPILGLGFGNYRWFTALFPIRGFAVQFNSHSQYVDIFAQTGVIGLICFLWFFAALGWIGWRLRTVVDDGFDRAYVFGALGGLVGTLAAGGLGDWILPFFYNVGYSGFSASVLGWLFLGGLVVLENKYRKSFNGTPVDAGQGTISSARQSRNK